MSAARKLIEEVEIDLNKARLQLRPLVRRADDETTAQLVETARDKIFDAMTALANLTGHSFDGAILTRFIGVDQGAARQ